jgi:hypothetical protein
MEDYIKANYIVYMVNSVSYRYDTNYKYLEFFRKKPKLITFTN